MNAVLEYLPGQLKCEDCIYNDNCESLWVRCVANWLHDGGVVHYVSCENKNYETLGSKK